jgi:hypothetical protein
MSLHRFAPAIAAMATAFIVAGCELLFPQLAAPFDPNLIPPDPNYGLPVPTVRATYTSGQATLTIRQGTTAETVVLDKVAAGSQLTSDLGATVTWRNDDGWTLIVEAWDMSGLGYDLPGLLPEATLTVERVVDNEFWVAYDTDATTYAQLCNSTVKEMSDTVFRGAGTCTSLRWEDGASESGYGDPVYVDGQDPFAMTVTFEAEGSAELPRAKN